MLAFVKYILISITSDRMPEKGNGRSARMQADPDILLHILLLSGEKQSDDHF